ncbi:MAG: two-component sensor histidine kinase [Ignavibacteriales bacterium]|nr:two-component sensor histidine kinase [Ignavibacteriales bacterium]
MNRIKENLFFARGYIFPIILVNLLFVFIVSLSINVSQKSFIWISFVTLLAAIAELYFVGKNRKGELDTIKRIIGSIRYSSYKSAEEIKLGKLLGELEDEIKAMFLKTQSDIANLKKLEHIRTEFLGNVSHELRTPIFAIQGYLETLLDGALEDENVNRTFLQKANQHTINLNNLLNDLIDISMIEAGQMKMSFRYFNVNEFLETIISEMKPHAQKKGIELMLKQQAQNFQVYGDKDKLRQVMVNLIMNAIKYTEQGFVEIGVVDGTKSAAIYVRDTGIGISENDLGRIFERFYRVDKDRSRAMGGTGLGLAIVKHILEAHNSKIEVKSEFGKGSEFSFYLKK